MVAARCSMCGTESAEGGPIVHVVGCPEAPEREVAGFILVMPSDDGRRFMISPEAVTVNGAAEMLARVADAITLSPDNTSDRLHDTVKEMLKVLGPDLYEEL